MMTIKFVQVEVSSRSQDDFFLDRTIHFFIDHSTGFLILYKKSIKVFVSEKA